MAKNPILPLYYNDILGSTKTWTDEEFGAYMRLLIEQWDKGCIPADLKRLNRIAETTEKNWNILKLKFKEIAPGNLCNENMETIRKRREKFLNHQRENGLKGGRPKTQKESQTNNQIKAKTKAKKKPLEIEIEKEIELEFELSFVLPDFKKSFLSFLVYRKMGNKPYKTQQSIEACYRELTRISNNDPVDAEKIVERTIANQWQGLFKLEAKENKNGNRTSNTIADVTSLIRNPEL
jgi:uncharacterized protein YdaU (DUF1376 family)